MATADPASSPPQPPSPGVGAVPLSCALGELLRFVLSSHLAAPDPALPLSPYYCSRLLDDDLCDKLASELARCIEEERLPAPPEGVVGIPAAADEGSRERELDAVVLEKGAELKRMYDAVEFVLHVREPYFTQLRAGAKTVEGRLAAGNYNRIAQGSLLLFNKSLLLNVKAICGTPWRLTLGGGAVLCQDTAGGSSWEKLPIGVKVYRKFYTEEKEKSNGVLAISVSKPIGQPYIIMKELLAGLGYDGLSKLLGMAKTAGTVTDGLPPPRSVLISSCMKLHQPTE